MLSCAISHETSWDVTVLHASPNMFIFSDLSFSSVSGNSTFESIWAWQYCSILWHRNGTFFWFPFLFYVHLTFCCCLRLSLCCLVSFSSFMFNFICSSCLLLLLNLFGSCHYRFCRWKQVISHFQYKLMFVVRSQGMISW